MTFSYFDKILSNNFLHSDVRKKLLRFMKPTISNNFYFITIPKNYLSSAQKVTLFHPKNYFSNITPSTQKIVLFTQKITFSKKKIIRTKILFSQNHPLYHLSTHNKETLFHPKVYFPKITPSIISAQKVALFLPKNFPQSTISTF